MFWYHVAPYTAKHWNILFENQSRPFIFDSPEDAIDKAIRAAKSNFRKNGQPSGVRVKRDGEWETVATFE